MIAGCLDTSSVAVITGGASGFGFVVAERLVKHGMSVAILDVSDDELANAQAKLDVLVVKCDVRKHEDCVNAAKTVADGFVDKPISLLFNNAGIQGQGGGKIVEGGAELAEAWQKIFSVNVFGAVNILKAFVPGMIAAGPLPSGKKTFVVTTSSVVGLLNHNIGPYSCSKMAATAVCEQFSHELENIGDTAAHISPHSLHPTVAATNFLSGRDADGQMADTSGAVQSMLLDAGEGTMTTADDIVDGLFEGLDAGKHYIIVDHPSDVPTEQQLRMRMEDAMSGGRPRRPEQLGMLLKLTDPAAYSRRVEEMGLAVPAKCRL